MAAGTWVFVSGARLALLNGTFDLDTDEWKVGLMASTAALAPSIDAWSNITGDEVTSASTGYTGGGASITFVLTGDTQIKVDISTDPVWTATTDGLTARYAVIWSTADDKILCYAPLESDSTDVTITTGNTLTVAAASSGVFTLS